MIARAALYIPFKLPKLSMHFGISARWLLTFPYLTLQMHSAPVNLPVFWGHLTGRVQEIAQEVSTIQPSLYMDLGSQPIDEALSRLRKALYQAMTAGEEADEAVKPSEFEVAQAACVILDELLDIYSDDDDANAGDDNGVL